MMFRSIFYQTTRNLLRRVKAKILGSKVYPVHTTEVGEYKLESQADANRNLVAASQRNLDALLASENKLMIGKQGEGPLVTVVLVLYNKAHLTYACLRQLEQSQHNNLNVLIIDNNSTDQTGALLKHIEGRVTLLQQNENLHFLRACNLAFDQLDSNTKYVALINNDALIDPIAITQALKVFHRWPDTGIVGGQILHLDGQLQEAGNVICRDGSCRGLGRRQSPWQPLAQARRKVDYVSGCFLIIDAALLKQLGGFDTRFSPAYYEETDLCVASWKQNRPVVYEPTCLLHHVEFASSGQGRSDAESLMRKNQLLFQQKHANWLLNQPKSDQFHDLPYIDQALRDQAYSVRILWIDDKCPNAAQGAGFGRLQSIISDLADLGCFITLFATDLHENGKTPDRSIYADSADYELQWGREEALAKLLDMRPNFYTHIIASRRHNQETLRDWLCRLPDGTFRPQVIADVESLFSIREYSLKHLKRTGEIATSEMLNHNSALQAEMDALKEFDQLWAVSQLEAKLLQKNKQQVVQLIGHSFASPCQKPTHSNTSGLLFMGAMNHPGLPNLDSLLWLAEAILPALRNQQLKPEDAPLNLIGPYRKDLVQPLLERINNIWPVVHLGVIPEIQPTIMRHRVLLAPTRFAAGLPHKVQHGISLGIPVVTTELIASQMGWSSCEGLIASNNAQHFASSIAQLYNDPDLWEKVQTAGLARIGRECCPKRQVNTLAQSLGIDR